MYKRPPKHIQRRRLILTYTLMTTAVIGVVVVMVMMVSNYGYNRQTGTFERRGLVQFASIPSGATVEVDDTTLLGKTSTKAPVLPGERRFAVWREGYHTWILNTEIAEGSLVWLDYIRLVPKNLPVEKVATYKSLASAQRSANGRLMALHIDVKSPNLRLVDISQDAPSGRDVVLPVKVYELSAEEKEAGAEPVYELSDWSENNKLVKLWRKTGDKKELILVNIEQPEKSINISRDFSLNISQAEFLSNSSKYLYANIDGNLRKLDIAAGTVTRILVSEVESFAAGFDGTITYVSRPDQDTRMRVAGVYRDGDELPKIIHSTQKPEARLSIAAAKYYTNIYTAVAEDDKMIVYRGNYDQGVRSLEELANRSFDSVVEKLRFSPKGSHVVAFTGDSLASYSLDRDLFSKADFASAPQKLYFVDNMNLMSVEDGKLVMQNLDGSNRFELNAAAEQNYQASLGYNGTYLYSFSANPEDGSISLQRVRMILR